jgi:hypothetical protein
MTGSATDLELQQHGQHCLVAEYESADVRPRLYVHGIGADVPLVWFEGGGGGGGGYGLYTDHHWTER